MIGRAGVGVDNVDVEAATRRGIVVANAPESTVISAAEHTIGLLLALSRHIPQAHAALKQGRWERSRFGGDRARRQDARRPRLRAHRPAGRAARRSALEMRVVAYDPFVVAGALPRARRRARSRRPTSSTRRRTSSRCTCRSPTRRAARSARDDSRSCATACGSSTRRAASSSTRTRWSRRSRRARSPRAALDVFSDGAVPGPAARARQRRRHAASRRVDRGGAGPRRRDRRRAGRRCARRRARDERGEHPDAARRGPRGARRRTSRSPRSSDASRWSWRAGRAERIELTYYGALSQYDTRLLTVAALNGAFQGRTDQPVNYVNAPLVAAERGIEVAEERKRASRDFTNLIRVARRRRPRRRDDDRARGPAVARERARLRARDGARAAARLLPLRRRAGRDRPRRHDVRRGGGEHREHDRLAHATRRQGADGAVDRLACAAGARRAPARRGLRRRAFHLAA